MKKSIKKRVISSLLALSMTMGGNIAPVFKNSEANFKNTLSASADEVTENITIEARIIFGDYRDNSSAQNRYENLNATVSLMEGDVKVANTSNQTYSTIEKIGDKHTPARKDWCYQYNIRWTVPRLSDGENYHVKLDDITGTHETKNEPEKVFKLSNYDVYYLVSPQ